MHVLPDVEEEGVDDAEGKTEHCNGHHGDLLEPGAEQVDGRGGAEVHDNQDTEENEQDHAENDSSHIRPTVAPREMP